MPRPTRGRKVPRGGQSSRGQRSDSITTATRSILHEVGETSFTPTKEDLQDLDKVCRLCMVRGGPTMEHIFRNKGANSIAAQITWVTQLEMRKDDPLPARICQQCIFRLTLSQNFKQQCVSSDKTLRGLYLGKKPVEMSGVASSGQASGEAEEALEVSANYALKVEPLSPCGREDEDDAAEAAGTEDFKIEIVEHEPGEQTAEPERKKKAPFVCEDCQRTYPTWDQLRRHRVYHSEKRVPCPECDRKFLRRAQLRRHLLWHSGEKPFACTECDKRFAAQTTLDVHARSHSGVKLFKCHLCDKTFGHNSTLTTHVRAHLGDRPYQCPSCPLSFTAKSPLNKHIRTHTGFKPHKCPDCPLTFTLPSSLRTHSRTHTGERPFPCPHCDKSFAQPGGLKNHVRIHTGSKPYECKICRKSYRQQGAYSIHMRTHANIRPYSCDVCSKSFNVKKTLARHIRVHTGEKTFECPVCRQAFSRDDGLASHMLIHSNERPFECVTCKKGFRQKMALVLHMRCHTGERPYKCAYCRMTFAQKGTMTTHMRVHTGEKPYGCSQCEKTFAQLGNLIYHKKRHHPYGEDAKGDETIQEILDGTDEEREEDANDDESEAEEVAAGEDGPNKPGDKVLHCCQLCSKTFLKLKTLIWHVERFHSYADELRQEKKKKGRSRKRGNASGKLASVGNGEEMATDTRVSISKTDVKSEVETKMDDRTPAEEIKESTKSIPSVTSELTNVEQSTNKTPETIPDEISASRIPDSQTTISSNTAGTDEPVVTQLSSTEAVDTMKVHATSAPTEDVEADCTIGTSDVVLFPNLTSPAKVIQANDECTEVIVPSASSLAGLDTKMANTSQSGEGNNTADVASNESMTSLTNITETTTSNSNSAITSITNCEIVEHNSFHTKFIANNFNGTSSTAETSDALEVVKTNVTEMETDNASFRDGFIENTSKSKPSTYLQV